MNQELTMQNKMLDGLDYDIDKTNEKMVKVDTRLKKLLAKSKTCYLWIFIILELAAWITIMILL